VLGDTSLEHGGDTLREDRMDVFAHGSGRLEVILRGRRNVRYRRARTRWFAAVRLRSFGPRTVWQRDPTVWQRDPTSSGHRRRRAPVGAEEVHRQSAPPLVHVARQSHSPWGASEL